MDNLEYQFPPKVIERFCYCANLQTEHKYSKALENTEGESYVYNCAGCNNERIILGGELETKIKE